jgi:hypothetical protein
MCWDGRNVRRERSDMAGEARLGGSSGRIFSVPLTRRAHVASPRFSVCSAFLERPLCSGDRLGAPDTVSARAGQKTALGNAAGNVFFRRALNSFGERFG